VIGPRALAEPYREHSTRPFRPVVTGKGQESSRVIGGQHLHTERPEQHRGCLRCVQDHGDIQGPLESLLDPQQARGQREAPGAVNRRDVGRGAQARGQGHADHCGGGRQIGLAEHPSRGDRARSGRADPPAQRDRLGHDNAVPRQPYSVKDSGFFHAPDFSGGTPGSLGVSGVAAGRRDQVRRRQPPCRRCECRESHPWL